MPLRSNRLAVQMELGSVRQLRWRLTGSLTCPILQIRYSPKRARRLPGTPTTVLIDVDLGKACVTEAPQCNSVAVINMGSFQGNSRQHTTIS